MPLANASTGRIQKPLSATARRILFQGELSQQIDADLPDMSSIDMAHVLMLAERGIVQADPARCLLQAILRLRQLNFSPLRQAVSWRGLFLMYEGYLIEREGHNAGGMLQMGRSRNDLNATLIRMKLRQPYIQLVNAVLRLQAVLIRKATAHSATVMPAYTHGQPAEPISYGHYLAGVAEAVCRDLDAIIYAARDVNVSPLGAAAVAGTSVPISTARTAELLGFTSSRPNSVDAVASRDLVLHFLSAATVLGVTLSRVSTDLFLWLTGEFQFLQLPDELVGSSSAMPQKRNPFLLEHVQGRTASALGAFVTAATAMRNSPFTNSIATGTESVRFLWGAIRDIIDATTLLRLIVSRARPCPERMLRRAEEGFTNATALAVQMVLESGMDFRSAHHFVGRAVSEAAARGMTSLKQLASSETGILKNVPDDLDPKSCVARARYGGGPAAENLASEIAKLRETWLDQYRAVRRQAGCWATAQERLEQAVRRFCLEPELESGLVEAGPSSHNHGSGHLRS
ncbi:MAG TPA: argininosuccinate lyase [Candidatus Angelobacter sp.]|nr:argininosuccinate lyase [Candidatus Angelobacter sp.]